MLDWYKQGLSDGWNGKGKGDWMTWRGEARRISKAGSREPTLAVMTVTRC